MKVNFIYAEKVSDLVFEIYHGVFDLADLATIIDYSKPLKKQLKQAGMSFSGSDQFFVGENLSINVSRKDALIAYMVRYRKYEKMLEGASYLFMEGETKHLTKITMKYNIVVVYGLFEGEIMWPDLMVIDTNNLPSDIQVLRALSEAKKFSDGEDDEYDLLQDVLHYGERGYYCVTGNKPGKNGIYRDGEIIVKF